MAPVPPNAMGLALPPENLASPSMAPIAASSAERARRKLADLKRDRAAASLDECNDRKQHRKRARALAVKASPKQQARDARRRGERLERRLQEGSRSHAAHQPAGLLPTSGSGFSGPRAILESVGKLQNKSQEEMGALLRGLTAVPFK